MRVVVGISGGVDSAVSALLLKKRGYDVTALHMINWDPVEAQTADCPRSKDESDAREVCRKLQIPFHTCSFVKEYWNEVFLNFVENYKNGRTVVPDIDCNRRIKFKHFHDVAREKFGAQMIATGHYASTSHGDFHEIGGEGEVRLLSGVDPLKDQSFFLSTLTQAQLKRAMFPVGSLLKTDVKKIAEEEGLLTVAKKEESMGICFVGKSRQFDEFVNQYIEECYGEVVDVASGDVIGRHDGIHHFTIGKRLGGKYLERRSQLGYFVAGLDPETNSVRVCEGSHNRLLYATSFEMKVPEWISMKDAPNFESSGRVKMRCRIQRTHSPVVCDVSRTTDGLLVKPSIPLRATAPGQTCVFYDGRVCLGGDQIIRIVSNL